LFVFADGLIASALVHGSVGSVECALVVLTPKFTEPYVSAVHCYVLFVVNKVSISGITEITVHSRSKGFVIVVET